MGKGYSTEEIREKLISTLKDSETGMSGVEISEKIGVNRITMSKYLKVFAAEGLLRQKNIGNVTLWFLEPLSRSRISRTCPPTSSSDIWKNERQAHSNHRKSSWSVAAPVTRRRNGCWTVVPWTPSEYHAPNCSGYSEDCCGSRASQMRASGKTRLMSIQRRRSNCRNRIVGRSQSGRWSYWVFPSPSTR